MQGSTRPFPLIPLLAALRLSICKGRLPPLASRSLAHWPRSPLYAPQARGSFGPAHAGTGELSLQGCALHGFGVCDDRRCVFCVSMCILGCRAEPCSVWAKPTTIFSPSPRERGRGLRGKGTHCLASLTHVFKLIPLHSGEGKSSRCHATTFREEPLF